MVVITEFRVLVPMTVDEYRIGQLYCTTKASKKATEEGAASGDGTGVEVLVNEPYKNEESQGQYTKKIYHLGTKMPSFIASVLPASAKLLYEDSWNGYPHCKTVLSCPYLDGTLTFVVETRHVDDNGSLENVHNLPPDLLKKRKIQYIDIANDPIDAKDYKADEDPTKWHSEKGGRGPLGKDWLTTTTPIMCCYKLVTFEFKWFGLQSAVESFIMPTERKVFTNFHRQLVCWMDEYYGWDIEMIRMYEANATAEEIMAHRERALSDKAAASAAASSSTAASTAAAVGEQGAGTGAGTGAPPIVDEPPKYADVASVPSKGKAAAVVEDDLASAPPSALAPREHRSSRSGKKHREGRESRSASAAGQGEAQGGVRPSAVAVEVKEEEAQAVMVPSVGQSAVASSSSKSGKAKGTKRRSKRINVSGGASASDENSADFKTAPDVVEEDSWSD